jgi:hypothetical protein
MKFSVRIEPNFTALQVTNRLNQRFGPRVGRCSSGIVLDIGPSVFYDVKRFTKGRRRYGEKRKLMGIATRVFHS